MTTAHDASRPSRPVTAGQSPVARSRRALAGWLAAALLLAVPSPASAWWGWLEKLSGPSDLNGPQFDFRVVCFGDRLPPALIVLSEAAAMAIAGARDVQAQPNPQEDAILKAWTAAGNAWEEAALAWADALGDRYVTPKKNDADKETEVAFQRRRATEAERYGRGGPSVVTATSSAGVLWSLCTPDRLRRFSLDVNFGYWRNDGEPDYAGGTPIKLNTALASVSWRMFGGTRWDIVDASAGAGMYFFTSQAFSSFSGLVIQPGRLTFHAPSSWHARGLGDWRGWAALPTYTIGVTIFPSGFPADAFAATGARAVRIPAEAILTRTFFLNVAPLLRRSRTKCTGAGC